MAVLPVPPVSRIVMSNVYLKVCETCKITETLLYGLRVDDVVVIQAAVL